MVNIGEANIIIKTDKTDLDRGLVGAEKSIKNFAKTASVVLAGIGFGMFLKSSIQEAIKFENAMLGLASVSKSFGIEANEATKAAERLVEDGLMGVHEAAAGLKNLLATGFNLPQSIQLMNAFKDAAAFNRQGTLEFGEAIVGATQGIKNQNSIMVDNVGITKNLTVIMKEAGFNMQDLSDKTKSAEARMALLKGILEEAQPFLGDATAAADSAQGAFGKWDTAVRNLKIAFAQEFLDNLASFMNMIVENEEAMESISFILERMAIVIKNIIMAIIVNVTFARNLIRELKEEFGDMTFKELITAERGGVIPQLYRAGGEAAAGAYQTMMEVLSNMQTQDINIQAKNVTITETKKGSGAKQKILVEEEGRLVPKWVSVE